MPRSFLPLCVAIALSAAAAPASASAASVLVYGFAPTLGGSTVKQQTSVAYEPAAAGDAQGASALLARISAAADQVCASGRPSGLLRSKIAQCREQAVRRAVREIGSPALVSLASADGF